MSDSAPSLSPIKAIPYGLVSLWDMINFKLGSYISVLECMRLIMRNHAQDEGMIAITSFALEEFNHHIGVIEEIIEPMVFTRALSRVESAKLAVKLNDTIPITHEKCANELEVLIQALHDDAYEHAFYHYPPEKAKALVAIDNDWKDVIEYFPECELDIRAGVDLWALHHNTASVFQFMRVLEGGLKRLARHLNIDFNIQNWQNIIDQIESEVRKRQKNLPRGKEKNKELQFLAEAAKEFSYFKDGWRNYVSHNKVTYDTYTGRSVMEHVRQFMITLSHRFPSDQEEFDE